MPRTVRTRTSAVKRVERNRLELVRLGRELRDVFRDLTVEQATSDELALLLADDFQRVAWNASTPAFCRNCLVRGWRERADEQADAYRQARGILRIEDPACDQLALDLDEP